MKDLIFRNQKGLTKTTINQPSCIVHSALCTKQLHSARSNSAFCILHSALTLPLLFLAVALMVSGNVWGKTWYGKAYAYAIQPNTGYIWVSLGSTTLNFEQKVVDTSTKSEYNWSSSATFTARYYAKPDPGYKFVGWFDNANCTGTNYSSSTADNCAYSTSLKATSSSEGSPTSLSRYAKFEYITYSVAFNGNGATGGSMSTQTGFVYNSSKTLTSNAFYRDGYTFAGWATSPEGNVVYSNGASVSNLTTTDGVTVTLYAKWTPITYAVHFDGNGNAGGSMSNMSSCTYDQNVTLTTNGYTNRYAVSFNSDGGSTVNTLYANRAFNGWEDRNSIVYKGTTYAYTTFDAPYYANNNSDLLAAFGYNKYNQLNHYVLYGKSEGRACKGSTPGLYPNQATVANLTTTSGATVNLYASWGAATGPITLPSATKSGQVLEGWYNGTTKVGVAGEKYTPSGDITLKAKWVTPNYTLTFNLNGGSSVTPTSKTVTLHQPYGDLPTISTTLHSTQLFAGWYTAADGGTEVTSATTVTTASDHEIFAHWAVVKTKIWGFVNSEVTSEQVGGQIFVSYAERQDLSGLNWQDHSDYSGPYDGKEHTYHLYARPKTGYSFVKWTTTNGTQVSTDTHFTPTMKLETLKDGTLKEDKYYAKFQIHQWKLTWAGLDGATVSGGTAAGTYNYGTDIKAPTVRKYGWKHNGWSPAFQSTMPDNNVTYTAQWLGVTVSGATAQTKNFTARTETQTATLTFPVTNATDKNDFNAPTLSGDAGWTVTSWSYANNNVTVNLSFTATENSTTSGNHVTTVTLKAKNNASATGQVTANVNMTPSITSTIASSYYVEDASINLNTAWASTSNGSKTYSIVSFSPASGEQSGSTAPAISSNVLSLGKAGTLVIKLVQAAGTSSQGYEGTKTITINRITNTLTADATHSMYVGDTWSNVYSNKNSNAPITTTTSASTWAYFNVADNKIIAQNTTNAGDDSKSVTIKIEQAETYKYTSVSKSIAVTVNKKTPSVNWTSQTYYVNKSYSNVFSYTGDASLFSSSSSDGAVAAMTGLTSMQTFNKSAATTITVTATENYMWKGGTYTTSITPIQVSNHVPFTIDTEAKYNALKYSVSGNTKWDGTQISFPYDGNKGKNIVIKFEGFPDKLTFTTSSAGDPKWIVAESSDGTTYTDILSQSSASITVNNQLKSTTRYIRISYNSTSKSGNIQNLAVSELQYFKTDISSISYDPVTIGSTAPIKSFKVQHCNAGYQTSVVAPAHFQVSLNQSDWSDEVVISTNATAVTGGDKMDEKTVYVKYLADVAGDHNGSIQVKNNLLADQTVTVSGSTVKMTPTCTWKIADQIANGEKIAKSNIATITSGLETTYSSSATSIADFEGDYLVAKSAGTTTITIHVEGTSMYESKDFTKEVTVTNREIQTITWNQNFDLIPYGTDPILLNATASSGLPVTYGTYDKNVAEIIQDGSNYYVKFVAEGETSIYAQQSGNGTYAPATDVSKFVLVYDSKNACPITSTLYSESITIKDGTSLERNVQIPAKITFESHADWWTATGNHLVVEQYVNGAWSKIYDDYADYNDGDYDTYTLTASQGLSTSATQIRFSTSASSGYKVRNVILTRATYTNINKTSLTFSAFPSAQTVAQTVTVTNANRMIMITCDDPNYTITPTQLGSCNKISNPVDLSVTYNAPATEGTYPAKLYLNDNTGVTMQTIDLSATVAKLSQTVAFSGLGSAYNTTDQVTLAATSNKSAEKERNFTYSVVSTNGVASITGNTLTFLKSGSATIRVTEAGDNMYNSAYADATIEVSKVTPAITTIPTAAAINYGNPLSASTLSGGKATTTLHGATGTEVFGTWAWHEPTAVKTANGGIAQAYQVDFTPNDGGMFNTTNCQVYVQINQIAQTINWNQTIGDQVYNGSLTLTASNGTAGGGTISYTWTPDLATISGSTLTFNKGVGTITVTARAASNANYVEATASKSFNIVRINPTITKKAINDTYLVDADQIDLQSLWTTNGDGVITYSKVSFSPSSTINGTATEPFISDNRYLSFGQAGTLVIRLSMAQGSYYNAITDEKTITINKRTPNIGFVNNTYYFNSTYPNVYTVNEGDATLCTLTSSDQDVAVVEGTGIKTYNKPASTKLTLTSAENYKWAKKTIETTITPTADPNVPAFYYTEAFFNHAGVTYSKVGVPEWSYAGYNPEGRGKLTLKSNDPNNAFSSVAFKVGGAPSKIFFEWSNNGITDGIFALWAATSPAALGVVWNTTSNNTSWNPVTYTCNGTDNLFQWAFTNHYSGGEFANMKIYGDAYILAADSVNMNYGTIQIYHPSVKTFKLAHANIGYNTTVSSNDAQFEVSLDGTNYASSQTISSYANQVTGGGKQGVITIYVKYVTSAAGTHNGTITISDDLSHTTSVSVTGTTVDKYDPVITNTIKDTYMIGDPTIDLNALWTSNSNGVRSYEITSWQPSGEHNEGAVAPSITDKKLSLGQAGTVQLKLTIQGTQAYKSATDTKTIVIKKYDPVATFSSQSYYYNGTYNNIYSVTAGESSLFSLKSSDPTIASAVGNSLTTFDKAGSTTLTVTATENYIWNPKTFTKVVTPTKESNHITFDYTEALYQDGAVTVQKSATTSWNGYLRLGDPDEEDDRQINYADIKFVGYPKSLTIQYSKGGGDASGTWQIFESADGVNWTNTWSADYGSREWTSAEVPFKSYQSRYVRFSHYGYYAGDYIIRINELEYYRRSGSGTLDFKTNKQGVVPAVQYFDIEHCNAGYVTTITAPAHYGISLSENGTYTSTIDYSSNANPNTGGDKLGLFRVYVKYMADAEGQHGGSVVVNNNTKGDIEIPVTGITQGKLNTTVSWTGNSSYQKGETISNLFVAKDDNGVAVAGTWELTSSATDKIKVENGKLITLCGGKSNITGSFTPSDASSYKSSSKTIELTVLVQDDAIDWSKYEDANHEIHFWAYDPRTISDLASSHTKMYYGPGDPWIDGVLTFNGSADAFTIGKHGTVQISTTSTGDCGWNSVSGTHLIYVDPCKHSIVWDQSFLGFTATSEGYIHEEVELTAYAVDSQSVKTLVPITYEIISGGGIASVSGNILTITGVGSAVIQAKTDNSDKYAVVTTTREIKVRKEGDACGTTLTDRIDDDKTINSSNSYTFTLSNRAPYSRLEFDLSKHWLLTSGTMTVEGNDGSTNNITKSYNSDSCSTSFSKKTINLEGKIYTKFTFSSKATSAFYIKNLYAYQDSYFKSDVLDLSTERADVNAPYSKTITISYSDVPVVQYNISDNDHSGISFTPNEEPSNDCGDWGTYTFTLSGTWSKAAKYTETITFWTSAGHVIEIPFVLDVKPAATYRFNVDDGNWDDASKWTVGGVSTGSVPGASDEVIILNKVTISKPTDCYFAQLEGSDAAIEIQPTGGLTVGAGGIKGFTQDNFRIKSSTANQGFFRMSPEAMNPDKVSQPCPMPYAVVEFATKATLDKGANKDAEWQYFGIPVATETMDVDYITWFYRWSEKDGWTGGGNNVGPVGMEAWNGYCVTQYGQPIYEWEGQLLNGTQTCNLTVGGAMAGDNMVANSFASPLDVKKFTEDDFSGQKIDATFYVFNTGSWNNWKAQTDSGQTLVNKDVPGSFRAIAILSAKYEDGTIDPTLIAPMQGICIHAKEAGAWVKFDYAKHVWPATSDKSGGMNDGIRAPQRVRKVNDSIVVVPDTVVADPDTLERRVRLQVYASNSGVDHLYLMQKPEFTMGYDNGYDAPKVMTNGLLNIYTREDEGEMAVSARNSIDSTYIGMTAGEDEVYKLTITSVIGDSMILKDMSNNVEIPVQSGQTYTFNMDAGTQDDQRFLVYKKAEKTDPSITTGNSGIQSNAYIWTDAEYLHIENAAANAVVGLFASDGKMLMSETINRRGEMSIKMLPTGMYLVYVDGVPFKFVKK